MTLAAALLVLSYTLYLNDARNAESKKASEISFGTEKSINVFPSTIEGNGWSNSNGALTQDLGEQALYQDFTLDNAAFIVGNHKSETEETTTAAPTASDSEQVPDEQLPTQENVPNAPEPTESEEAPPEPEPTAEPEPAVNEPVSVNYFEQQLRFGVVNEALEFPLAQLTLTSSTPAFETITPTPPSEPTELPVDSLESTKQSETAATTTAGVPEEAIAAPLTGDYDLVLSNFSTVELEPGQFINALQLRLSFAGAPKAYLEGEAPYIEVFYENPGSIDTDQQPRAQGGKSNNPKKGKPSDTEEKPKKQRKAIESAGVILLDSETSNADMGCTTSAATPGLSASAPITTRGPLRWRRFAGGGGPKAAGSIRAPRAS